VKSRRYKKHCLSRRRRSLFSGIVHCMLVMCMGVIVARDASWDIGGSGAKARDADASRAPVVVSSPFPPLSLPSTKQIPEAQTTANRRLGFFRAHFRDFVGGTVVR